LLSPDPASEKNIIKNLLKEKIKQKIKQKEEEKKKENIIISFPEDKPTFDVNLLESSSNEVQIDEKYLIEQ
jgi:hypothetical protein